MRDLEGGDVELKTVDGTITTVATRPEVHREKKSLRKKLLQALYGDDVHYVVNGDVSYNSAQKARIDAERLAVLREARSWRWPCPPCSRPGRRRACARGIASWPSTGRPGPRRSSSRY